MTDEFAFVLKKLHPQLFGFLEEFECGDGWFQIILKYANRLKDYCYCCHIPIGKNGVYVSQVKQKFGGIRFHILGDDCIPENNRPIFYAIIHDLEIDSEHTCEWCGDPGKTRENKNYAVTLCNECVESGARDV